MQTTVQRVLEKPAPSGVEVVPWMFKVCKNLWIDELRSRDVRRKAASRPELAEESVVCGEATAIGELTLREIEGALARLPDEQRAVLALVAIEGFSYREAAGVLDIPIGTVMSRLARARGALADMLSPTGTSLEAANE